MKESFVEKYSLIWILRIRNSSHFLPDQESVWYSFHRKNEWILDRLHRLYQLKKVLKESTQCFQERDVLFNLKKQNWTKYSGSRWTSSRMHNGRWWNWVKNLGELPRQIDVAPTIDDWFCLTCHENFYVFDKFCFSLKIEICRIFGSMVTFNWILSQLKRIGI
jgi:hypothetical protein